MRNPSMKYLYGVSSTYGVGVNATQAEIDAVDAEFAAEQRAARQDRGIVDPTPEPDASEYFALAVRLARWRVAE